MWPVDTRQELTESQRAEAFREFTAEHLRKQTKYLDTIRTLMILWFVLALVVQIFVFVGAMAG